MIMTGNIAMIAFSANGTQNPDAFIVVNIEDNPNLLEVNVKGTKSKKFNAYRTTEDEKDQYSNIGTYQMDNGKIIYEAPAGSVTTFFGE